KAQERTAKLQRKPSRTPKEDMALAKAEAEMTRAADVRMSHVPSAFCPLGRNTRLTACVGVWGCRRPPPPDPTPHRCRVFQSGATVARQSHPDPEPTAGAVLHNATRVLSRVWVSVAAPADGRSDRDLECRGQP